MLAEYELTADCLLPVRFRMNPFSLGWYFPLLVNANDVASAVRPSSSSHDHQRTATSGRASSSSAPLSQEQQQPKRKTPYAPTWMELDEKFRRDLPDAMYVERLAYRGMVMRACEEARARNSDGDSGRQQHQQQPGGKGSGCLRMLDGVEVTDGEREKAAKLLIGLEKARKSNNSNLA